MKMMIKNVLEPMMSTKDMINNLKMKNIKFKLFNERQAFIYLKFNNNYYNVTCYKNNFLKYPSPAGKMEGKYLDLDFAYLKDLSIIDMKLRLVLNDVIMDIEHYLKLKILNLIEKIDEEDGYRIVNMYLENDYNNEQRLHNSILKKVTSTYYKKIFSKYDIDKDNRLENIPIWEFLEIITMGELINFYEFFTSEYGLKKEKEDVYIMKDIVKLRNAVAHNANILSDLGVRDKTQRAHIEVIDFLDRCGVSIRLRSKRLSNSRIRQITYALYMFDKIVTSNGVKYGVTKKINDLFYDRIPRNKNYYKNNELLQSVYHYFDCIIKKYYVI